MEAIHWVKGKLIGTGAFCSCFLARDMENGTMFAVKQVRKKQLSAWWVAKTGGSVFVEVVQEHDYCGRAFVIQ